MVLLVEFGEREFAQPFLRRDGWLLLLFGLWRRVFLRVQKKQGGNG